MTPVLLLKVIVTPTIPNKPLDFLLTAARYKQIV